MRMLRVIVAIAPLFATGCIVFPSSSDIAPAISGTVTDVATGRPVVGATVRHRFDDDIVREVHTDPYGHFAVRKLQQHHWGYMFGIALNYPLPYWKVLPGTPVSTELSVLYPGYEPYRSQMEFSQRKEQDGEYVSIPDVTEVDIQLVPMQDGS